MGKLLGVILQEIDQIGSAGVVISMVENFRTITRACERHRIDFADACFRTVGHEDDAVGEIQGLIDVMRHHDNSLPRLFPNVQQLVLQIESGERVKHGERLIEQQKLRLDRKRPGHRNTLLSSE